MYLNIKHSTVPKRTLSPTPPPPLTVSRRAVCQRFSIINASMRVKYSFTRTFFSEPARGWAPERLFVSLEPGPGTNYKVNVLFARAGPCASRGRSRGKITPSMGWSGVGELSRKLARLRPPRFPLSPSPSPSSHPMRGGGGCAVPFSGSFGTLCVCVFLRILCLERFVNGLSLSVSLFRGSFVRFAMILFYCNIIFYF